MSAQRPGLLVISALRPDQMAALERDYDLVRMDQADDPRALVTEVGGRIVAAVTTGSKGLAPDLLPLLPALRILAVCSVGVDGVDLDAFRARGIVVTNTPDVLNDDVADLAMGLILATHRQIVPADAWVRSGNWATQGALPLTTGLAGRRLGLLGMGGVGSEIAARATAFRMPVGYCTRHEKPSDHTYFTDVTALATWADVLVLCLPGGPATRHMVDAPVLRALGPKGVLINVARGSVVDQEALCDALSEGQIAAAGLDVFETEPCTDDRLLGFDQVVLHPHHGSGTVATRDAMSQLVVDNITAVLANEKALTPVD
ncbi:2-hydroxyacid dehydrogenase [Pseudooceanicola algae]|uniref:2-ketogluconate reductase n=1 Tax=Pseudooceanicola algae TaxID=1537215 RepID=A0A418SBQ9_9RHOB|nr:2-hydroxyacid dehydrogenase [Pseudooceanicola algae]QPM92430.1 2-ketogluconate reductase [Pseudooceanicola algae]